MKDTKWEIVHVPDRPPIPPDQQPTVDVFASAIDPKLANTLIRQLNRIVPLENLRHVKRIQKKRLEAGRTELLVILCLASKNDDNMESMPNTLLELVNSHQLSPYITKVCRYAASTKEQWVEQCKLWPTSFHPPSYNIDGIVGFSEEDSQSVCSFMKFALELSRTGSGRHINAAVIVDPSAKQVIASAVDQVCSCHSPGKKTGLANECYGLTEISSSPSVANGVPSHKPLHSDVIQNEPKYSCSGVSCLYPWQWTEQQLLKSSSCNWHPLRHAAILAIESSAARDRHLFPSTERVEEELIQMDHLQALPTSSLAKTQKTSDPEVEGHQKMDARADAFHSDPSRPYLCTGYDVYLLWEPCTMCSMALVHQRIRRVFFAFANPNDGALGSVYRLQGEKSLNHHYAVFKVSMPEESLERDA